MQAQTDVSSPRDGCLAIAQDTELFVAGWQLAHRLICYHSARPGAPAHERHSLSAIHGEVAAQPLLLLRMLFIFKG